MALPGGNRLVPMSCHFWLIIFFVAVAGCGRAQQAIERAHEVAIGFKRDGSHLKVPGGGDLQGALDAAQPGDTVELEPGATYRGPITLKPKKGDAVITIQPSDLAAIGGANSRIRREAAAKLPKIVCSVCPAIKIAAGAHHYRLNGIEVFPNTGGYLTQEIVQLGDPDLTSLDQQAHDIELDHMIIHGDSLKGGKRGIALFAASVTIKNSAVYDFKSDFQDAQAIHGFNGPGPYRIINNYLEASGENIMFGGAAPHVPNLVPSDIEVYHNYISRPLSWQGVWRVKNLFELKNARRVNVHGNIFENNWVSAQSGFAILFTVRTCEGGDYPWAVVENVTFHDNILRNVTNGINISGQDDLRQECGGTPPTAGHTQSIRITNNFIEAPNRAIMILSGAKDIAIDHNTSTNREIAILAAGPPSQNVTVTNNIFSHEGAGILGDNTSPGLSTMKMYFPGIIFRGNVMWSGPENRYPPGNFFPPDLQGVGFVDVKEKNFALASNSRFRRKGTDGRDPGADFHVLAEETAGVIEGVFLSPR